MDDQGDAEALAELGVQLYYASGDGEAAEVARLLDLFERPGQLQRG